ncbi:hypothetical protein [Okeania sp. SIO3B5]|nr:hypothetical protein [Okeania sp. SIO3B5]
MKEMTKLEEGYLIRNFNLYIVKDTAIVDNLLEIITKIYFPVVLQP